ncbi:MAG: T9SS type A sorting domain-containing protein [candidate division WOR-3 bacterium]|nr:T9SS type A sorting domain-containing protein [candidate division WOR-3 bacterium]
MLVGQEGIGAPCNVFVYINQGTNSNPVLNDSTPVLRNGSPFRDYRTIPVALDLDHDGKKDLILGEWYSSVRFYQNMGTNSNPVFTNFINLVPPDPDSFLNGNPPRVNFTDWDGDTDLDMITCDYYGSVFLRRNITPAIVKEQDWLAEKVRGFEITPNPIKQGFTTLRYSLSNPGPLRIRIYDISGRRILSQTLNVKHEVSSVNLDLRHFSAGVYLLKLETNRYSKTCKLVKTQ